MAIAVRQIAGHHLSVTDGRATLEVNVPGDQPGFSSEGLLLGALGTCISGNVLSAAEAEGMPISNLVVEMKSVVSLRLNRITRIRVQLSFDGEIGKDQYEKLLAVASSCKIHNSLHEGVEVAVETALATHGESLPA